MSSAKVSNLCLLLYYFKTITYRSSRQTLHATESSVSLVSSLSSLTSLSSVSLGTSRALNTSNRRSLYCLRSDFSSYKC